ncbi:hypothetical protein K440DRAFT_660729 [Wilcoxina mikolae CBS 423.85]|nr:hypothetical protein K440DRAFT_660729 [Wilcoxina mikolae CBS 423.85]
MASRGKNTIFRVTGIPVGTRAEVALKSSLDGLPLEDDKEGSVQILRSALSSCDGMPAFADREEDEQAESFLRAAILIELSLSERKTLKTCVEILPSCYHDDMRSALLYFIGDTPSFLQNLVKQLAEEYQIAIQDVDVNIDRNLGLLKCIPPPGILQRSKCFIVAVAGLDGHAWGSWRGQAKTGRMWLRDYFRHDFPNYRTMVYGYNSKIQAYNIDTIMDYGRGFLEEIRKVRRTREKATWMQEKERPLILIGHSFGGLLIAQSLVSAALLATEDPIWRATIGFIFFGVPHKGLVVTDIQRMIVEDHPRQQLLSQVSFSSRLLADQLAKFKNLVQDHRTSTNCEFGISIFLRMPLLTGAVSKDPETQTWRRGSENFTTSVDEESALLQFPDNIEVKIPVNANHSDMVKFDSRENPIYSSVVKRLKELGSKGAEVVHSRLHNDGRIFRVSYLVPIKLPFPPNHNFIGRIEELEAISRAFKSLNSGISNLQKVVVLHGLGGIGKTQLAAQYCYSSLNMYTFIGWIDATKVETISSSFLEIAQQLVRHHASNQTVSGQNTDFEFIAEALGMPAETFHQPKKGISPEASATIIDAIKRWFCAQ